MVGHKKSVRLQAVIFVLAAVGCTNSNSSKRNLTWDFSSGRGTTALNGGEWVGGLQQKAPTLGDVYYVSGHQNLSLTVILSEDRRFDFKSVSNAYATGQGDRLRTVDIDTGPFDGDGAFRRLKEMHKMWGGSTMFELERGRSEFLKPEWGSNISVIHSPTGPDDPSITTNLRCFGKECYILVTFFWHSK
jgi:hypothetical protein